MGIKASSKRKIIPEAYEFNVKVLKNIIDLRKSSGMPTILDIPPLLYFASGKEIPYFRVDYLNFKNEMNDIYNKENCIFLTWTLLFQTIKYMIYSYLFSFKLICMTRKIN